MTSTSAPDWSFLSPELRGGGAATHSADGRSECGCVDLHQVILVSCCTHLPSDWLTARPLEPVQVTSCLIVCESSEKNPVSTPHSKFHSSEWRLWCHFPPRQEVGTARGAPRRRPGGAALTKVAPSQTAHFIFCSTVSDFYKYLWSIV